MKTLFTLLLAVVVIISFSMTGFANMQKAATGSQTTVTEKKMQSGHQKTYSGKVVSFDKATHTLVVKGLIAKKTFDVSNATINGVVRPGQKIHVTYYKENGRMVASSVGRSVKTAMHHGTKTSMNWSSYGTDPYNAYSPYFYGSGQYGSSHAG